MSAKGMIVAMVAGTGLVVWLGSMHSREPDPQPEPVKPVEPPTLSKEAAAQLVGDDAGPGPLFAGVAIGGSAPSPAARARIAEFAKNNHVDIDLETRDDKLVSIRLEVRFKGAFGYEGADVFALRLKHPHTGACTGPDTWIDLWAFMPDSSIRLRARVKDNRVEARWEKPTTFAAIIARADDLLGKDVDTVRQASGDRWHETPNGHYLLEEAMPYPRASFELRQHEASEFGYVLSAAAGKIVRVQVRLRGELDDREGENLEELARARWGTYASQDGDHYPPTWTWKRRDRTVKLEQPDWYAELVIRAIGYTEP